MEINLIKGYVKTSEGIIIKVFISGIMMGFKFVLGLLSFPDHVIAFILLYWILLDYQMVLVFSFYQQQKELWLLPAIFAKKKKFVCQGR